MDLKQFDWVKARADCDAYNQFVDLRELAHSACTSAKERVEKRSALFGIVFENDETQPNVFSVVRQKDSRIFRLEGDSITVTSRKAENLLEAKTLLKDGECVLEVDGELLTTWEFSRLALESSFSSPPSFSSLYRRNPYDILPRCGYYCSNGGSDETQSARQKLPNRYYAGNPSAIVPGRWYRGKVVCRATLAAGRLLPLLRVCQGWRDQASHDALPLPRERMPQVFQRQNRNSHAGIEHRLSVLAHCHLPVHHRH